MEYKGSILDSVTVGLIAVYETEILTLFVLFEHVDNSDNGQHTSLILKVTQHLEICYNKYNFAFWTFNQKVY